jgi:hypothetical protein
MMNSGIIPLKKGEKAGTNVIIMGNIFADKKWRRIWRFRLPFYAKKFSQRWFSRKVQIISPKILDNRRK